MNGLLSVLLGLVILVSIPFQPAQVAAAPEKTDLLCVAVEQREYRLGESTVLDFAAAGWPYHVESDGVYGFHSLENESYFYAETLHGAPDDPVTALDFMWADGVDVVYQGFSALLMESGEQEEGMWDWLVRELGASPNEEGALTAYADLGGGRTLQIETDGTRVRLRLTAR